MKPEEAIKLLGLATKPRVIKEIELSVVADVTDKFLEANRMGIDALKKQIPTKPKKIDWYSAFKPCAYICPTCGVMLDEPSGENRIPKWKKDVLFCDGCGQAIDWSDYETD